MVHVTEQLKTFINYNICVKIMFILAIFLFSCAKLGYFFLKIMLFFSSELSYIKLSL